MQHKLIMTWDITEGKEQEYFDFLVNLRNREIEEGLPPHDLKVARAHVPKRNAAMVRWIPAKNVMKRRFMKPIRVISGE